MVASSRHWWTTCLCLILIFEFHLVQQRDTVFYGGVAPGRWQAMFSPHEHHSTPSRWQAQPLAGPLLAGSVGSPMLAGVHSPIVDGVLEVHVRRC